MLCHGLMSPMVFVVSVKNIAIFMKHIDNELNRMHQMEDFMMLCQHYEVSPTDVGEELNEQRGLHISSLSLQEIHKFIRGNLHKF